ncbi:glutathionylspermidine synthase family protein [Pyxidicoccus parkwayensis]|uniref:Glutathionylspermidine synthase family protein n=1 Tax=Pyxidicoccus parkwayensis TaxID=2813578 RepID=A0ABX7P0E9_9BACT|nr:glutathionylspermidine synthase family protein [Pyxidicoccus parkwaysis]QSQ23197.1 glutathionylspermidine synthase family protein [Pyxidicoccus parkwaysis]
MMSEMHAGVPFKGELYEELTHRAILECHKWNLGAGDRPTMCRFPLIVSSRLWNELGDMAEALVQEAVNAERELLERPELHALLGLSKKTASCLRGAPWSDAPRYTRLDFHPTDDGFRITESNCDVAGGLLEASGVGSILASLLGIKAPADPAGEFADAFAQRLGRGANVGLAHLANYSEDRQVVLYLARRLQERGLKTWLFHPSQLRPGLQIATPSGSQSLDAVYRFLPGDWLEQLPSECGWKELFSSERVSNPLSTLLVQSKRFPLVWPELRSALPTWGRLLPETKAPVAKMEAETGWVLKPAFGHEGANIVLDGSTVSAVAGALWKRARRNPTGWVAQRRFESSTLDTPEGPRFPCIGIFVVGGRRAGGYARLSTTRVIDASAQEAVVLVEEE